MIDLLENEPKVWIDINPHSIFWKRFEELSSEKYKSDISDADALMFLVLIRKVEETLARYEGSGLKNKKSKAEERQSNKQNDYIKFFCDWAVHSRLGGSPVAFDVFKRLNLIRVESGNNENSIENWLSILYSVLDFSKLRLQIAELFVTKPGNRPPIVIHSDKSWFSFCCALLRLIEGSRLCLYDSRQEYKDLIQKMRDKSCDAPEKSIINTIWVERDFGNEKCFVLKAQQRDTTKFVHYVNILDKSENGEFIKLSSHCRWR